MIKAGWDAIRGQYPEVEITFFGARVPLLFGLQVQDNKLIFTTENLRKFMTLTSNGVDHIAGDYDVYLIVGCEMSLSTVVVAAKQFGPAELENLDATEELGKTRGLWIVRLVREITTSPIVLLPAPYHTGADAAAAYEWGRGARAMKSLNRLYLAALHELAQTSGFVLHLQPRETLRPVEFLTLEKFAYGSERYDHHGKEGQGDGKHMNAEFGMLYLHSVLSTLGVPSISGIR